MTSPNSLFSNFEVGSQPVAKQPVGHILQQTKLSRLPSLSDRKPFTLSAVPPPSQSASCAACGARIDRRDERPFEIGVCAKCLKIHVTVDEKILENAKSKNREWLEKAGGQG